MFRSVQNVFTGIITIVANDATAFPFSEVIKIILSLALQYHTECLLFSPVIQVHP